MFERFTKWKWSIPVSFVLALIIVNLEFIVAAFRGGLRNVQYDTNDY